MSLSRLEEHLWDTKNHYRDRANDAEGVILALRRKLREADPSLPVEFDGTSWAAIEASYWPPSRVGGKAS